MKRIPLVLKSPFHNWDEGAALRKIIDLSLQDLDAAHGNSQIKSFRSYLQGVILATLNARKKSEKSFCQFGYVWHGRERCGFFYSNDVQLKTISGEHIRTTYNAELQWAFRNHVTSRLAHEGVDAGEILIIHPEILPAPFVRGVLQELASAAEKPCLSVLTCNGASREVVESAEDACTVYTSVDEWVVSKEQTVGQKYYDVSVQVEDGHRGLCLIVLCHETIAKGLLIEVEAKMRRRLVPGQVLNATCQLCRRQNRFLILKALEVCDL